MTFVSFDKRNKTQTHRELRNTKKKTNWGLQRAWEERVLDDEQAAGGRKTGQQHQEDKANGVGESLRADP